MGQLKSKDGFDKWHDNYKKQMEENGRYTGSEGDRYKGPDYITPVMEFDDNGNLQYPILNQNEGPFNVVLFGTGDSGKSTLLKHLLSITTPKTEPALDYRKQHELIRLNVITGLLDLAQTADLTMMVDTTRQFITKLIQQRDRNPELIFKSEELELYKQLWNESAIQTAWTNRSTIRDGYYLIDYWMSRIDDIANESYVDNVPYDDWLRARITTCGIFATTIETKKKNQLSIIDCGGQKAERKRWIHVFERNIAFDIHVVSLAEFSQCCYEDYSKNRFIDSLFTWDDHSEIPFLGATRKILVFSKLDLFRQEFALGQFKKFVPEYTGDENDPDEAVKFVKQVYLAKISPKQPHRVDVVIGDLLNPETTQEVLDLMEKHITPTNDPNANTDSEQDGTNVQE